MVKAGLAATNSEASRLIQGGGVQIEGQKVSDIKLKLSAELKTGVVIKAGKKKFVKVILG
ncbi:tyrosyl-tRNA synthetase [compost metagenome]